MTEQEIKEQICEIGRWVHAKGFVAAFDGNLSVRFGENLLITPTAISKGRMTPDDIIKTDLDGKLVEGRRNPSSEIQMHLQIYRQRADVQAVCHVHPPFATAFAVAGIAMNQPLLSEVILTFGCIPLAEYATPTTRELPDSLVDLIPQYDAILLANHGAVTFGDSLISAYYKMEVVDHSAKIYAFAKLLGRQVPLGKEQVDKLFEVREKYGIKGPDLRASGCPVVGPADSSSITLTREELITLLDAAVQKVQHPA